MSSNAPLRLASFDGGGPSSFSQLLVMAEIMSRLKWDTYSDDGHKVMLPCEHFDLMGGSDTGGLIVIMFVKLRMSVEEVMEEFAMIVGEVYKDNFTPAERTSKLRGCMQSLLKKRNFPLDSKLEEQRPSGSCVGFVVTARRLNVRNKVRLRTYPVPTHLPSDITVIDAAIATCASQPGFLPLSYGAWYESQEYIGAGLGANNPVRQVIEEATSYFRHQPTAVLISFGSGHPGIFSLSSSDQMGLYLLMQEMMADSEQEAQNIQRQVTLTGYFRFSVEQGMQRIDNTTKGLEWISAQTSVYLSRQDIVDRLDVCVAKLIHSVKPTALKQHGVFSGCYIAHSLLTWIIKHLRGIIDLYFILAQVGLRGDMKDNEYDQQHPKTGRGNTRCNIPSLRCCRDSLRRLGRLTWDFICSIFSYFNGSDYTHSSGAETRHPEVGEWAGDGSNGNGT